jgi:MFS family permease
MPLAVTSYDFSLFLHITAVMVGLGSTFAESIMFPVAMKMSPRHLPYVHRLQLAINQWFASPALVIVLATGIYQVSDSDAWELGDFWISATLSIVIVISALIGGYFIPADRRLGPMVQRELDEAGPGEIALSDLSPEYQRQGRMEGIVGSITGVLLIVAVYLMVVKPGA